MKNLLILVIAIFAGTATLTAQVGIATLAPTAQLELDNDALAPNFPLLELNPQTAPAGTATGQLAVIGDLLYMYDSVRSKWLSIQAIPLQFSRNGSTIAENLFFGDTNSDNTGPLMPFDGTIVALTAKASAMSATTKRLQVRVRNGVTNVSNTNFSLSNTTNSFNNTAIDTDFSAGDYLLTRGRNTPVAATADDVSVVVWVKWRQ